MEAATTLFAERGPAAVSLRDVAGEANVNLGLIHRYIGGKQDLLHLVLERRPGMPELQPAPPRSTEELVELLLELIAVDAAYTRILLRATLDGFEVPRGDQPFPLLERAIASARTTLPPPDAELRVSLMAAAAFGWQALGPLFLGLLGQTAVDREAVAESLRPALIAFVEADPA